MKSPRRRPLPPDRGRCPTTGKRQLTHPEARHAADVARRQNVTAAGGPPLEPYRCDCGWWHIGHRPARLLVRDRPGRRRGPVRRRPTPDGYERLGLPPAPPKAPPRTG